ncbi:MAG: signal recognition particle subunit SRP19/SEC65 family protein [Candidatus Methanomethylicaceae archaeon]
MSRDKSFQVIWASDFDSQRSRMEGRRVPKSLAVESPSIEEIFEACKALGLDPILERDKRLPRSNWEKSGRVLVKKVGKKTDTLLKIARILHERSTKSK